MPDPSRRRKILEKMGRNLTISLSCNDGEVKIHKAVEKVREGKISFYKGQREIAKYQVDNENMKLYENIQHHLSNIEKNIKLWESMPENEIINMYSSKNV